MPTPKEVTAIARALGEKGLINLDASVRDHLEASALDSIKDPGELAGWYAVGGDHFVIVCGLQAGDLATNPG